MKIALCTYSTRARGGVVHTLALAEAIAALGDHVTGGPDGGDEEIAVTVFTLGRGGDAGFFRPVDPSVEVCVVPCEDVQGETVGERVVRSIELLGAAVDPSAFDVVHAQDCISANAVPSAVRTVHHLDQFTTPQLVACHERAIVTPPHHVCVSWAVARELQAGWGIEAEVIPNGVDAERFAAAAGRGATEARANWRRRIGGPYVLSVGGIEPRKGTLDLLDAMALLRSRRPELRLVVAGGETLFDYRDYRAEFDRRCVEVDVEPVLVGPVDHEALPALVAGAGAFAFPSTKEGFGLAAMEALAARVPVVTRHLPVLCEVFGDTVETFDDVPTLAARLAAAVDGRSAPDPDAGVDLAFSHRWSAAARRHLDLYRRITT